ncbi:1-deoxy-D-xylulose-5-phosphate reductoisomerase [Candidatus Margulisiibacteriota bacterium]
MKKKISILGSTGSIGKQTLAVVNSFCNDFEIVGLAAGNNIELLKEQIIEFKPQIVSVITEKDANGVKTYISQKGLKTKVVFGEKGLIEVATYTNKIELLIVAVVGTAALMPTYLAIEKGLNIGLACKEVLVAAGPIIMKKAKEKRVTILPIDSEHAAIKQCLAGIKENKKEINKLILTASGGPFWQLDKSEFKKISKKEALKHPKWHMGPKITIDSASLMNKGLEVIEAHYLFDIEYEKIKVVIHPQSIVHSMVEFSDSTVLAQMGQPDMRFPIQYVLTYPQKITNNWPKLDFDKALNLEFRKPDLQKFPLLKLAYEAGKKGGSKPIILNAANEAAVAMFLQDKISFYEIPKFVTKALKDISDSTVKNIEEIVTLDKEVKNYVKNLVLNG